jgi:hypothetical protein
MGGEAYEIKKKNPLESRNQKGRERERERERRRGLRGTQRTP